MLWSAILLTACACGFPSNRMNRSGWGIGITLGISALFFLDYEVLGVLLVLGLIGVVRNLKRDSDMQGDNEEEGNITK